MAKSYHREANVAKWIGVRPAHNGVQVSVVNTAQNDRVTLYTVPSGYVLLVSSWTASHYTNPAGAHYARLAYFTSGGVLKYICSYKYSVTAGELVASGNHPIPFELTAGEYIELFSTSAAAVVIGSFHGFLVPVNEFN